jgi:WD40 repeat protein
MSIAALVHRHVFGAKTDVNCGIGYVDDQNVAFTAGHNVVLHSLEQKTQKFLPGTENTEDIVAMAISPNRKFLAVSESSDKATVTIFDCIGLKRRRMLQSTECLSKEFVSISFSSDSRVLIAQGGAPDWTLVIWSWEKSKQLGFLKMAANPSNTCVHAACSIIDPNSVSVVGNGILKQIKILESGLKLLPSAIGKRDPQNYTAQAWTSDDRLIVGTDHGDILVIEGCELKSTLNKSQSEVSSVESLCVFAKGFIVGSDEGVITLFEKTDDRELYKRTRSFRNDSNSFKVRSMALSPSEDTLVIALDNSQLFTFSLSNADIRSASPASFVYMRATCLFAHATCSFLFMRINPDS